MHCDILSHWSLPNFLFYLFKIKHVWSSQIWNLVDFFFFFSKFCCVCMHQHSIYCIPSSPLTQHNNHYLWLNKAWKMTHFSRTLFFVLSLLSSSTNAQLSTNFYDKTCPNLQTIVRNSMEQAINGEPRLGASILRLFFHDCFVNVRTHFLVSLILPYTYICNKMWNWY